MSDHLLRLPAYGSGFSCTSTNCELWSATFSPNPAPVPLHIRPRQHHEVIMQIHTYSSWAGCKMLRIEAFVPSASIIAAEIASFLMDLSAGIQRLRPQRIFDIFCAGNPAEWVPWKGSGSSWELVSTMTCLMACVYVFFVHFPLPCLPLVLSPSPFHQLPQVTKPLSTSTCPPPAGIVPSRLCHPHLT